MKCDYCARGFEKGPVEKIIRGRHHLFCSEYCYVLHHYRIPRVDIENVEQWQGNVITFIPDFRELIEE